MGFTVAGDPLASTNGTAFDVAFVDVWVAHVHTAVRALRLSCHEPSFMQTPDLHMNLSMSVMDPTKDYPVVTLSKFRPEERKQGEVPARPVFMFLRVFQSL